MSEKRAARTTEERFYYCRTCKKGWSDSEFPKPLKDRAATAPPWPERMCIHCYRYNVETAVNCARCGVVNGQSTLEKGICSDCRWKEYHSKQIPPAEEDRILSHAHALALRGHNNLNISIDLAEQHPSFEKLTPDILTAMESARHESIIECLQKISRDIRPYEPNTLPGSMSHIPTIIFLLERIEKLQEGDNQ